MTMTTSIYPDSIYCRNSQFKWGERTYIMGVINVTPDSFSHDGLGYNVAAAEEQAKRFVDEGIDILDVGGESTRPDFKPISIEEELHRVIPVIERLAKRISTPISIDTYKSEVARQAIDAGACMINDVWGLRQDPKLAKVAAEKKVPVIIVQNQRGSIFNDLIPELISSLSNSIDYAVKSGVDRNNIIIDPGFGFGKTIKQNLEIIRRLDDLKVLGRPILLGTSRKSTIGAILDLPVEQRIEGTAATVAIGIARGADIIRIHDVPQMTRVIRMSDAIVRKITGNHN